MSDGDPSSPAATPDDAKKEYLLRMVVEIVDIYIRSSAGISAEVGLEEPLPVEALMIYCLSIPAVEDLIYGFIRGDLTMFSLADQTRQLVERDTRRLELDPAKVPGGTPHRPGWGRNLQRGTAKKPKPGWLKGRVQSWRNSSTRTLKS